MKQEQTARIAVAGVTYWVDRPYTYAVPEHLAEAVRPGVRVAVPFGGSRPREGVVLALGGKTEKKLKSVLEVLDQEPLLTEGQLKLALWMRERFFCTVMDGVKAMLPSGLWYRVCPVYCLAEGMDRTKAYQLAGKSKAEILALDAVTGHGGRCELADIEAVFGAKNPGPALASLVKKGVLSTGAEAVRRGGDKTIQRAALAVSPEEALAYAEKNQRAVRQASVLRVLAQFGKVSVADLCYFTGTGRDTVKRLAEKGLVTLSRETVYRRPDYGREERKPLPVLNAEQQAAFDGLLKLMDTGKPQASLLFGVTGSGKTTVYIHLIHEALGRGRSAIFLVPEIALTPQMIQTFSAHFGNSIAVLHSSLSMGERYDEWKRIRSGDARVVIGTRSAVFAPVTDLGVVIIDEEQEDTYKSETAPRYHARDVAKFLCAQSNALLVLGSATPDVRSRYYADTGRYHLFTMTKRYNAMQLPQVRIADMKREIQRGNGTCLSSVLREEIEENLSRDEQTILFLNRRGANKLVACGVCGYTYKCPNCTANLTYHSIGNRLMCHYCDHTQPVDAACPNCGGKLSFTGIGTQKAVEQIQEVFPDVPILRMDADAVAPAGSHRALFEQFRVQRIPILVGTQMVTKGLNFENVTLVGVLSADQSLYASQYRAGERTFSLITQVIGRSGRFSKPGRAVIQTFTPENQIIQQAARQDYDSFYRDELSLRQIAGTPPFSELFVLTATGEDEDAVLRCCRDIRREILQLTAELADVRVLGPAPLPVARMNKSWRYRVTVSGPEGKPLRSAVSWVLMNCNDGKKYRGVSVYADYDPLE
ncbi:MAG: primosomal protein N' [Oscillospiraceae bacterium]|nr:primosomal protein N' [Oscillospiraceae bacterium]